MDSKYESLSISAIDTFYTLGLMLGPSLGGVLFDAAGVFLPFVVFGMFSLILTILTCMIRFSNIVFICELEIGRFSFYRRNVPDSPVILQKGSSDLKHILSNPEIIVSVFGLTGKDQSECLHFFG